MRSLVLRTTAVLLSVLLLTGASVNAGPVTIHEVTQIIEGHELRQLRLTYALQNQVTQEPSNAGNSRRQTVSSVQVSSAQPSTSLLSGIASDGQKPTAIEQGEIEGTICDCGEIKVAGELIAGGFPVWPLLFLGAIPLFFIDHNTELTPTSVVIPSSTPTSTPTPTPNPPTPQIPEPTSLLLLASGVASFGYRFQRRNAKERRAKHDV